jgi:serine/threonine protein kinase
MTDESIFAAALQKTTPDERAALLDQACADDPQLRRRVEALLKAHEQSGGLLDPTDATADLPTPRLIEGPGSQVGPYKLREKIGEGGMGIVYLAAQEKPVKRRVALKIIKPGMDSEQVVARFEAERQALALMDHPSIAKVLDAGATETGRPYFVMELVKGVPITDYCDTVHLAPKERLELFIPVCQAIQHAHQKGIIHRDVKPSNVLVTMQDGKPVPKIIDFGIAKATEQRLTERSLYTQHGTVMGTLEYMSPEQAELSALDVDTRTDIYALGVLLYELLTGTTPLERQKLREAGYAEILRRIREEEPPKPSTRLSGSHDSLPSVAAQRRTDPGKLPKLVRGELDWIVMKAIEKDRTRRYETANGLARDVERYLHEEPVEAGPPSATYRLRKYARKHRAALLTLAAFAGFLVLAAAVSTWLAFREMKARDAAEKAYKESQVSEAKAREEEAKAKQSAAEASAVLNFLEDEVLSAARPEGQERGLGKDVTIRKAIDAAEPKIAGSFKDQPTVEASIRSALGTTYWFLGETALAIRQHERALGVRTSELGPEHSDTLLSRNELAVAYEHAGRYAEAIALNQETLKLRSARFGPDHPDTLQSRNNLAVAYGNAGLIAEAIALEEETLKLRAKKLGADHPQTLISRSNLATSYWTVGRTAEAIALHEENLSLHLARQGPDHPSTLISRNNLATAYLAAGRSAQAIALHEENLKRYTAKLDPDHPHALVCRHNLANAYLEAGRISESIAMDEEVLRLRMTKLGPHHSATLITRNTLARSYEAAGRFAQSEPILRECLAIRASTQPDDWWTFSTRSQLGGSLIGQKKFAEAEPLVVQGYEGLKAREAKIPAPNKKYLTEAAERVVKLYEAWGKPDEAAEWRKKLGINELAGSILK